MLGEQLLVVSDAHLGAVDPQIQESFLDFLESAPSRGDALLVNGDLFDFWFSYRRVIPREGFTVAAALGALRKRMPVVVTGGNHDRWGDGFWQEDLNITFATLETRLTIGSRDFLAIHGDGVTEEHWSADLMHRITRNPVTIALWRALHPDLGFWFVDKMSKGLGYTVRDQSILDRVAARQQAWATDRMQQDPGLAGIIMGHTHRAALVEPFPGRFYVNPGAWFDGHRYAVVTADTASLETYR